MLDVVNVTYAYQSQAVLKNVSLTVNEGEILCLLGASGCGKTTLLRIIAGLESPYEGDLRFNEESIKALAVHQRDFGLMFQDFALFPHMNVAENVAFGLKMRGLELTAQKQRIQDVLDLAGLGKYHKRNVGQLSGGEKQRVALARSLAPQPRLLMLDEPLGSLDTGLRERLVLELKQIIKQVGLTAIYVTHDQNEAYAIADRIAVMNAGRIEQISKPEMLYWKPQTRFVANFIGLHNIFPAEAFNGQFRQGDAAYFLLHPEKLSLAANGTIRAQVEQVLFQGAYQLLNLTSEAGSIRLTVPSQSARQVGDEVLVLVSPDAIIPLEA